MTEHKLLTRYDVIVVVVVLLLASILRLGFTGTNRYAFDEAMISNPAIAMARGGEMVYLGTFSSVGVPFLPMGTWLFVPPYLFSSDPLIATLYVGVINSVAVFGIWALAWRIWGRFPALVALLFLATAPYAVYYSRNIWQPNFLIPLSVAWGWATYLAITSPKPRWWVALATGLAGITFQVHFAGAALLVATGYLFLRYRWWRHWLPIGVAIVINMIGVIPYIYHVACCAPVVVEQFREVLGQPSVTDFQAVSNLAMLVVGAEWQGMITGALRPPDLPILMVSIGILVLFGAVMLISIFLNPEKKAYRRFAELIILWLVASPLVFLRHSSPVNPYYQLIALPAVALMLGAAVLLIPSRWWRFGMVGAVAILGGIWSVQMMTNLDTASKFATPGGYSTPLNYIQEAVYRVPADTPAILLTHGGNPRYDGIAAVFATFWWDKPQNRILDAHTLTILPPMPTYYISDSPWMSAWQELTFSGLAEDTNAFSHRQDELPMTWALYDGETEPANFISITPPILLENGIQLEGWRVRWVWGQVRVSTLWRVVSPPSDVPQHQFHHLRDASTADMQSQPLLGYDIALSNPLWRVGDRIIFVGGFVPPHEGEFWVDIGQYVPSESRRLERVDGEGTVIRLDVFDTRTIPDQYPEDE